MNRTHAGPGAGLRLTAALLASVLLAACADDPAGPEAPDAQSSAAEVSSIVGEGTASRWIVTVEEGVDPAEAARSAAADLNGRVLHVYRHALTGYAVELPVGAGETLGRRPGVASASPDLPVHTFEQTLPTGIDRVEADRNSVALIEGTDERVDVDVAIIDTGIDLDHPDLNVAGGVDCTGSPWNTSCKDGGDDGNGHGTHVAGTAAALDNGYGVVGVAPGARLWAVKVLGNDGSGWLSNVIGGIDWVTANAATLEVANMSLGGTGKRDEYRAAIANSVAAGVVYVVAAGNSSKDVYGKDGIFETDDDVVPAAYPEVATISALTDTDGRPGGLGPGSSYAGSDRNEDGVDDGRDDTFAFFSNFSRSVVSGNPVSSPGRAVDLLLPGVDIRSTYKGGGYATYSGTSMASPHGAGLAALHVAEHSRASDAAGVYAVRQALIDAGVGQATGSGLVVQNDPDGNEEKLGWADDGWTGGSSGSDEGSTDDGSGNEETVAPADTAHVGDLDGSRNVKGKSGKWEAAVTVTVHDGSEAGVADAAVYGTWSEGTGSVSGLTGSDGRVTLLSGNVTGASVSFAVDSVTHASLAYDAGKNHDPDGDSDGTVITVSK